MISIHDGFYMWWVLVFVYSLETQKKVLHITNRKICQWKVSSVGVEPTTLGLLDPRSNQLSYEDKPEKKSSICDSDLYVFGSNSEWWIGVEFQQGW